MRGMGAAAVVCVVAVLLTACGSGGNDDADAQPSGSASAVEADKVTVTQVTAKEDLRAAASAGHFGRPAFTEAGMTAYAGPCMVSGWLRPPEKPDHEAVTAFVGVLEDRGWQQEDEPTTDGPGEGYVLEKGEWSLAVATGAESVSELAGADPALKADGANGISDYQGLYVLGMENGCGAGAATPSS